MALAVMDSLVISNKMSYFSRFLLQFLNEFVSKNLDVLKVGKKCVDNISRAALDFLLFFLNGFICLKN